MVENQKNGVNTPITWALLIAILGVMFAGLDRAWTLASRMASFEEGLKSTRDEMRTSFADIRQRLQRLEDRGAGK